MVHEIGLSVVIFRGGVLIVAALTAGMSIFLGWQLFRDALFSKRATDDLKFKEKQDAIAKDKDRAIAKAVAEAITGAPKDKTQAEAKEEITVALTKAADDARIREKSEETISRKEIESKSWFIRFIAGVAGVVLAIYGGWFLVSLANSQSNITADLVSQATTAATASISKPKTTP
jgi:hypothetical protein